VTLVPRAGHPGCRTFERSDKSQNFCNYGGNQKSKEEVQIKSEKVCTMLQSR
jgi:hypothetical protein